MLGSDSSRDIHHGLTNLANIDLWALLHLSVLLVVGVTQVLMVKQLFEDRSVIRRLAPNF